MTRACLLALVGLVALILAPPLAAQQPPRLPATAPAVAPSRYAGTVLVGAAPAAVGSVLEAWVVGVVETRCGRTTLTDPGFYRIDVGGADPACNVESAPVVFRLDGRRATPTGVWVAGGDVRLDLTITDQPPAPPPPPVPANFAAVTRMDDAGGVYLAWEDASQLETRFEIERWEPAGADTWRVTLITVRANIEEATDQPGSGGAIFYRIRACRELTCSGWSEWARVGE